MTGLSQFYVLFMEIFNKLIYFKTRVMKAILILLSCFYSQVLWSQTDGNIYKPGLLCIADVMRNTFMMVTDSGQATCFLAAQNSNQLLITAKHVFKKADYKLHQVHIKVNIQNKWKEFSAKIYWPPDTLVDIAVMKIEESIELVTPLEIAGPSDCSVGKDCAFFGFPYGVFYSKAAAEKVPFAKRAMISALYKEIVFLDGINNPGFSGGPVVLWSDNAQRPKLFGVISGYYPQTNKLKLTTSKHERSVDYQENSGIIYCYPLFDIENIFDVIQ